MHAARIAGMAAARRRSYLRRNAAAHSHRGGVGRFQSADHRRRTAHAPGCPFLVPGVALDPRHRRHRYFHEWNFASATDGQRPNDGGGVARGRSEFRQRLARYAGPGSLCANNRPRLFAASARWHRRRDRRGISADKTELRSDARTERGPVRSPGGIRRRAKSDAAVYRADAGEHWRRAPRRQFSSRSPKCAADSNRTMAR